MTAFDIQKAREFIRLKREKTLQLNRERFQKAWKDFDDILAFIIEKYVLKSEKIRFLYIGYTKDLKLRFEEHNIRDSNLI